MDFMDVLSLFGGLALFLLGMDLMSKSLEKKAGGKLKQILESLTKSPMKGFLLGILVTAVIQSSSATTVMVVGFVSAGIMTLRQSIYIIMGANIGTTVTAWLLSLIGIDGGTIWVQLFKPTSFTPILALIGIVLYLFFKSEKRKTTGMILLGFAVLMTGMSGMSDAVSGLKNVPEFANVLLLFRNPLLGVLCGAVLTAVIQSSSASVGILQALSATGAVTFGAAIPIIMGQNIGTCVTALIASAGANKDAKRTAMVHLYFNIIGTLLILAVFYSLNAIFRFSFVSQRIDAFGIAILHTLFNVICTACLLPFGKLLERLACLTVRERAEADEFRSLDERICSVPAVAVARSREVTAQMGRTAAGAWEAATAMLFGWEEKQARQVQEAEDTADRYEDRIGSFLVRLSKENLSDEDSEECAALLRVIGDWERISDHAVNLVESGEEIREKKLSFSSEARQELELILNATKEIVSLTVRAFETGDAELALKVEPLEQVIDELRKEIRRRQAIRQQRQQSSITDGFVMSDILTNLERVADHCSNIAVSVLELSGYTALPAHAYLHELPALDSDFQDRYASYREKYRMA